MAWAKQDGVATKMSIQSVIYLLFVLAVWLLSMEHENNSGAPIAVARCQLSLLCDLELKCSDPS